jgi:CHAT domain-containing protein/Tfp pilus assembly protein PilF
MSHTPRSLHVLALVGILTLAVLASVHSQAPQTSSSDRAKLEKLLDAGTAAVRGGDPKKALSLFLEAVPLAETDGDQRLLAKALSGLGWSQWATGQYETSLVTRRRALEILRKLGDRAGEEFVLQGLGETYYSLGRYDEALEQYKLGLEVNKITGNAIQKGTLLSNMGSTYRSQGRFAEASDILEQALATLKPVGDWGALAQVYTFLGIVSRVTSEFDRSLHYYREALDARRRIGDRRGEAQVLGNMGNLFIDLGQYEEAIDLSRQSLALAESIEYTAQIGFAHQNLGAALSRVPRPKEALQHYQAALSTFQKIGRRPQITWNLHNIGSLRAFLLDDEAGGRATLLDALEAARTINDREAEAYNLYRLASLDNLVGNPAAATERLERALAIARDMRLKDLEYLTLSERGTIAYKLKRIDAAIEDFRASAAIVNDLRANVSSDLAKIAYVDTRQSVFQSLAGVLAEAGRTEESLEAAEAARARAFADLLNQRRILGRPAERAALTDLRNAVTGGSASIASSIGDTSDASLQRRGADPIAAAVERVRLQNQELASLVAVQSPTANEIKAIAARLDSTIVEYLVTDRSVLVWVISSAGTIQHVPIAASSKKIEQLVESLQRGLEEPTQSSLRNADQLDPELRALYTLLIAPIVQWLPPPTSKKTVLFVPHGAIAFVPFAALENSRGVPLVEHYTIATAPAISIYRYTAEKRRTGVATSALIVSDPLPPAGSRLERLPGSRYEGSRVARRLGSGALLLNGSSATEAAVKERAGNRHILHFATHGLISSVRPVASSLVLAQGAGEDGYLRVDEIFSLNLSADLVVLSGCSTGLGRLTGDGMFGLTRAFIYAGTPTVVVTNWDVTDQATAFLVDQFYAGLAKRLTKAQALAAAQRASRRRFPHPALWAAFTLVGEPG